MQPAGRGVGKWPLAVVGCDNYNEWPRVESNHRTQIRSLPLYPLSYGAAHVHGSAGQSPSLVAHVEVHGERRAHAKRGRLSCPGCAVAVAQLVEPRVVVPVVAGSNPVRHPFS
jgi:hypothetical protein